MNGPYIDADKARDTWYESAETPKLAVNYARVRFNKPAMDEYGLDEFDKAAIFISDDGYQLGIKPTVEKIEGAFMYSFKGNSMECKAALEELNVKLSFSSRQFDIEWDDSREMVVLNFAKAIRKLSQNAP